MARTEVRSLSILTDTREAQQAFEILDRQLGRVGQSGERMARQLNQSGEAVGNFSRESVGLSRSLGLLSNAAGALGGVLASDAFAQFAENLVNIQNSATRLGTTVESIQSIGIAASSAGLVLEDFTEAFITQQELLSEAAREGTGGAAEVLEELGINAQNLINLGVEDQFRVLAEAISQVENEADQTRLAIKLWGTEGATLLPILKDGAAGFDELTEAGRNSGRVLSGEAVQSIIDLQDRIKAASAQIKETLLPVIVTVVEGFNLLATQGERAFRRIANAFGALETDVQKNTKSLKELTQTTVELQTVQAQLESAGGFDPTGKANERISELQTRIQELNQQLGRGQFAQVEEEVQGTNDALDQFQDQLSAISQRSLPEVENSATDASTGIAKVARESQSAAQAMREAEKASEAAARAYEQQGREIERITNGRGGIAASILQTRDEIAAKIERQNRPVWKKFWDGIGDEGQRAATNIAGNFVTAFTRAIQGGDIGAALQTALSGSLGTLGNLVGTSFGGPLGGALGGGLGGLIGGLLGGIGGGGSGKDTFPIGFFGGFGNFQIDAGPDAGPYEGFLKAIQAIDDAVADLVGPDGVPELEAALESWGRINRRMVEGTFDVQEAFNAVNSRFRAIFAEAFPEYLDDLEQASNLEAVGELLDEIIARQQSIQSVADRFGVSMENAERLLDDVRESGEDYSETLERIANAHREVDDALGKLARTSEEFAAFQERIGQILGATPWDEYTEAFQNYLTLENNANVSYEARIDALNRTIAALGRVYQQWVADIEAANREVLQGYRDWYDEQVQIASDYYDEQRKAAREWYEDQRDAAEQLYESQVAGIESQLEALEGQREIVRELERAAGLFRASSRAAQNLLDQLTFSEASPLSAAQRLEQADAEILQARLARQAALRRGDAEGAAALSEEIADLLNQRLKLAEEVFQRGSREYADIFNDTTRILNALARDDANRAELFENAAQSQTEKLDSLESALESELEAVREKLDERFAVLDKQLEQRLRNIDNQERKRLDELKDKLDNLFEKQEKSRQKSLELANERYRERIERFQELGITLYRRQLAEQQAIVQNAQKQVQLTEQQLQLLRQIEASIRASGNNISRTTREQRYA